MASSSGHDDSLTSRQQSSRIGEIVQAVKSGQKDKSSAFAELQGILRTSSQQQQQSGGGDDTEVGPETGDYMDSSPDPYAELGGSGGSGAGGGGGRISQEDRRMLINKLIEKKKANRAAQQQQQQQQYPSEALYGDNDGDYGDADQSEYYGSGRTPQQQRMGGGETSYYTRGSMDDTYLPGDSRSNRIAQTEAAIRQEMFKECRFRPVIKELPNFYPGVNKEKDVDFYDRVTKWQKEKEAESGRRKTAMANSDMVGCTFQPKINRNSERAVKEIRGEASEAATDRLYKSNEVSMSQRASFIEEELQRERKEEQAVCTFQPRLVSSKRFSQVKSKFTKIEPKKEVPPEERPEVKLCTFTPKVKGVRASMPSAQLYISSDVVERLTRPIIVAPQDDATVAFDHETRPTMDMASFMGTLNTPGSRPASAPPRGELSEEEKEARRLQFKLFLGRQEQQQMKRTRHIEEVRSISVSFPRSPSLLCLRHHRPPL